jgi:acetyltransferase-like isoleucine patch superfamily enzyme
MVSRGLGYAIPPDGGPAARLGPGEEAGARPHGLRARGAAVRRRVAARLRGEQDLQALIAEGLDLGPAVFIARGFYFDPGYAWLISIGAESTIGPNVTILTHDATPKLRTGWSVIAPVRIGARVFVGANATILPGTSIGDDAIVGAASVVRRDVPAGTVVTGNPAEPVGTTEAHTARHVEALRTRPRYPLRRGGGLPSAAERRRMLAELAEGPGYVD